MYVDRFENKIVAIYEARQRPGQEHVRPDDPEIVAFLEEAKTSVSKHNLQPYVLSLLVFRISTGAMRDQALIDRVTVACNDLFAKFKDEEDCVKMLEKLVKP